jgi:acyl-CoA hydrolase
VRVLLTHRRFVEPVKLVITYGGLHIRFHFSFFHSKMRTRSLLRIAGSLTQAGTAHNRACARVVGNREGYISSVRFFSSSVGGGVRNHVVEKTPITSQLWALRNQHQHKDKKPSVHSTDGAEKKDAAMSQPPLLTKSPSSSRLTLHYPFDTDESLRDLYIDHIGGVSIGKLFEDLDAMAGNIAHTHCNDNDPNTPPLSLVTASADNIALAKKICLEDKLVITGMISLHSSLPLIFQLYAIAGVGQVIWVGNSSLDVVVEVHRCKDGSEAVILDPNSETEVLSSVFTYVARNKASGKAHPVNRSVVAAQYFCSMVTCRCSRLKLETKAEMDAFNAREALAQARKMKVCAVYILISILAVNELLARVLRMSPEVRKLGSPTSNCTACPYQTPLLWKH